MLDTYQRAVVEALLRISNMDYDEHGEKRCTVWRDGSFEYVLILSIHGEKNPWTNLVLEMIVTEEDGIVYVDRLVQIYEWTKKYMMTMDVLVSAIKCLD